MFLLLVCPVVQFYIFSFRRFSSRLAVPSSTTPTISNSTVPFVLVIPRPRKFSSWVRHPVLPHKNLTSRDDVTVTCVFQGITIHCTSSCERATLGSNTRQHWSRTSSNPFNESSNTHSSSNNWKTSLTPTQTNTNTSQVTLASLFREGEVWWI